MFKHRVILSSLLQEDSLSLHVYLLQPWWRRRFETPASQTLNHAQERRETWKSARLKMHQWAAPAPRRNREKPPGSFFAYLPNIRITTPARATSYTLLCALPRGSTAALHPEGCWQWQRQWSVRFREAACVALPLYPLHPTSPQPPGWGHQH